MLTAGQLLGRLARRLSLPRLVGELAGGLLLGPTVFADVWPHAYRSIFPPSTDAVRADVVQLGLIVFLLSVGAHVDLGRIERQRAKIVLTSLGGILVPFALGYGAVLLAPSFFLRTGGVAIDPQVSALLMGTLLSISALPVIARILSDIGLLTSDIGAVVMSAATLDDLAGWALFAVMTASIGHASIHQALLAAFLTGILFLAVMRFGRPFTVGLCRRIPNPWILGAIQIAAAIGLARITGSVGMGPTFGAFLAGIVFSSPVSGGTSRNERGWVSWLADEVCAPLYFVSVGLQTNFAANFDGKLVFAVLAVAFAGKILGAAAGARLGGAGRSEALAIGFGLNARGTMAIVLVTAALARHIVSQPVFVAVVVMSLVTSLFSGPVMTRLVRGSIASSDSEA